MTDSHKYKQINIQGRKNNKIHLNKRTVPFTILTKSPMIKHIGAVSHFLIKFFIPLEEILAKEDAGLFIITHGSWVSNSLVNIHTILNELNFVHWLTSLDLSYPFLLNCMRVSIVILYCIFDDTSKVLNNFRHWWPEFWPSLYTTTNNVCKP